ncbi:PKD domain-containing protein [Chryseolinea soli]|uniref:T9SS C-terminal target domain-containing protein n=1 Tax=Chryseolinea soli TaxID=2321403 RepID=A0A385SQW6_9BACT|nr:PKD domain-containing protein [Chryseolinea soli]AYB33252.1 T9SS C-terminal target domain-containing protein [Chryseolinea soli]
MKIKILLLWVLIVGAVQARGQSTARQTIRTLPNGKHYWEYLPPTYSATGQKIPVVIFLHGLLERGDTEADMSKIINVNNTPPNYVEDGHDFQFVLISPQLPSNQGGWNNKNHINPVVDYVLQNYNVDPDQLYLTGLSLGGGGVWGYAQDPVYGQKVRGIAPVCGHQNDKTKACNIANNGIRVWAFHGEDDTTVSVSKTINMVDAINACIPAPNPLAIKTIYPGVNHNAWDNAYRIDNALHNPNVYDWMMQTFNKPAANAGVDRSITLPKDSVILMGSGTSPSSTITGYAWQQVSGPTCTLSGTTTSTLSVSGMTQGTYVFSLAVTDAASNVSPPDQVTITVLGTNVPPVANAGGDVTITLSQSPATFNGSGSDSDGLIATYLWTKQSGGTCTLSGANTATLSVSNLSTGTYTFRLTVTDNNSATAFDDVNLVVNPDPIGAATSWNAYDIVMQSTQAHQGLVNSTDNSVQATVSFFQSTNDGGVKKSALLSTYNAGAHPNANSFVATYWALGSGNVYPYAGKSTVGRGSETGEGNVPSPTGVFDLQLHPPNSAKLIVSAFVVPVAGEYTLSNLAVRRVSSATGTTRLKVFDSDQLPVADLQATNNQDWVQNTNTLALGTLSVGDSIYFAVDREGNYASDFTEVMWTVNRLVPNTPPVANAGTDVAITLPQDSVTLSGSGMDSDGTIAAYAWTQQSGPLATISGAGTQNAKLSQLSEGEYVFRLTVTDDDGATAFDEVTVVVNAPVEISWNSYDIVMQSTQAQQGKVNSTDNSTQATIAFFQSTNDGGVRKNALLPTYNSGAHPNVNSFVATYWANASGNTYPYAGKSTVGRGSETGEGNVPSPTGVFDLQLHPPNSLKLIVAAFVVPADGEYAVSSAAVRRVSSAAGTARLKVFNNLQSVILNLQATNNQDWVQSPTPLSLGVLAVGDSIYFAVDRDGNYASDFTEVAWTVTMTPPSSQARMAPRQTVAETTPKQPSVPDETPIGFYPNPVKNVISFQGVTAETQVTFYNSMGALLQQTKIDQAHNTLDMNSATFSPGMYIMILKNPGAQKHFKFLIER